MHRYAIVLVVDKMLLKRTFEGRDAIKQTLKYRLTEVRVQCSTCVFA